MLLRGHWADGDRGTGSPIEPGIGVSLEIDQRLGGFVLLLEK